MSDDVHFDLVIADRLQFRLAHFELVMTAERFLQTVHREIWKVKCLRVTTAGFFGGRGESSGERMPIRLRHVDRERGRACAFERANGDRVVLAEVNVIAGETSDAPAENDERLRSGNRTERVAD